MRVATLWISELDVLRVTFSLYKFEDYQISMLVVIMQQESSGESK